MKRLLILAILVAALTTATLVVFMDGAAPQIATAENRASQIVIDKSRHKLTLLRGDDVLVRYPFRSAARTGHTDCASEGVYSVRQRNPKRLYRLSLGISRESGAAHQTALIHGHPRVPEAALALVSKKLRGCIGVTNDQMRDIWSRVSVGTKVIIQ